MKILLVEDEKTLSNIICKGLKKLNYVVDNAFDGEEALDLFYINTYDLIILDINLPKLDGFEVLKKIRKINNEIKIIILSAKNMVQDKILGLDLGANDYLEKPFDFLELEARIRNLLRWKFVKNDNILNIGCLKIDTIKKQVFVENNEVVLTNKEYGILEYLCLNRDRFVLAEEIIEHVWESDFNFFSNTFKFHIHSLKKKLNKDGIIKNTRGKGYIICEV